MCWDPRDFHALERVCVHLYQEATYALPHAGQGLSGEKPQARRESAERNARTPGDCAACHDRSRAYLIFAVNRKARPWVAFAAWAVAALVVFGFRVLRGPGVSVLRVQRTSLVQQVVVSGRVLPRARVELGSLTLGRVTQIMAREGDSVGAGQVLVQLDDAEARAQLAQAQAALAQARARLEQTRVLTSAVARESARQANAVLEAAEINFVRIQTLVNTGGVAEATLDDARRALSVARAQQAAAEAQVASVGPRGADHALALAAQAQALASVAAADVRVAQTRLTAPVDGVVLARHVELGDVVSAGKVLLVIAQAGATELSVFPDEKNLAWLALGQKARASADAYPEQRFDAAVSYIAPAVDPQRGTVEVRLGVASPPAYLLPDMTVSVNIEVAKKASVLFAPPESLRDVEASHARAFVLQDGRVQARTLALGVRGESAVEVVSGLSEGELLITGGRAPLEHGMRAHVIAAKGGGS